MSSPVRYVIPLRAPLNGVTRIDPSAPLPPLPAPPVKPPPPPELPPPPAPPNFRETEIAKRLEADRSAIERTLAGLTSTMNGLKEKQQNHREELQRAVIELAVTLATRLVHDRIQEGNLGVENLVSELLDQFSAGPVTVYLHPDDLALLEQRLGGEKLSVRDIEPRLLADPELGRGDCRAEGGEVLVLSQLEVQLSESRRQLLRSLGHARP